MTDFEYILDDFVPVSRILSWRPRDARNEADRAKAAPPLCLGA